VRLGVSLPVFTADPSRPLGVAAKAAELGFDGVFSPDHFFPPVFYPPSGPHRPALESFTTLAAAAALHPSLHVGTLVARVTLRPPGLLAKQAAALDQISDGKAILALGTGDAASKPEHEMYGFPYPRASDRVALLEETVVALRALFDGGTWSGATHVPALTGPLLPPGSPQLWVGGRSDAVLGVAARVADAWNGWGDDLAGFAANVARLRELADGRLVSPTWSGIALVGEDEADLERLVAARSAKGLSTAGVWTGTGAELRSFVDGLGEAGATWFVVLPAGPADRIDVIAAALIGR
jgi:alkanesulfonate monooxygenase SsuD/methylene tetrahydromethanopterin reductase-like flavin-dependent oxidoreductase (luciferase family)